VSEKNRTLITRTGLTNFNYSLNLTIDDGLIHRWLLHAIQRTGRTGRKYCREDHENSVCIQIRRSACISDNGLLHAELLKNTIRCSENRCHWGSLYRWIYASSPPASCGFRGYRDNTRGAAEHTARSIASCSEAALLKQGYMNVH
jgi:hypothetical protein